jgi:hypothetical protein
VFMPILPISSTTSMKSVSEPAVLAADSSF